MNTAAELLSAMRRNPLDWQLAQLRPIKPIYIKTFIELIDGD